MKNRKRKIEQRAERIADENRCCLSLDLLLKSTGDDEEFDAILYERVSDESQSSSLENRIREDVKLIEEKYGGRIRIIAAFSDVCDGRPHKLQNRDGLKNAIKLAKKKIVLVIASSVDRFLRPEGLIAKTGQFVPLLESDVRIFKEFLDGVIVATLIPPNTDKRKVRGLLSKMGQQATGNVGGRPRKAVPGEKKRLREEYARAAYRLRCRKDANDKRTPYREIANILLKAHGIDVSFRTVYGWVKWYRKRRKLMKETT